MGQPLPELRRDMGTPFGVSALWPALLIAAAACSGGDTHAAAPAAHDSLAPIGCVDAAGVSPRQPLAPVDADDAQATNVPAPARQEFRCVVSTRRPPYRVVLARDTMTDVQSVAFYTDSVSTRVMQTIVLDAEFETTEHVRRDALQVIDLDADGFGDLLVGRSWGATGNTDYGVWFFDSTAHRFVVDTAMRTLPFVGAVPGRPCVWTHWHSSAFDGGSAMYCRRRARWIIDSAVSTVWDRRRDRVIETTEARRGDTLVVTRTRVLPDPQ